MPVQFNPLSVPLSIPFCEEDKAVNALLLELLTKLTL